MDTTTRTCDRLHHARGASMARPGQVCGKPAKYTVNTGTPNEHALCGMHARLIPASYRDEVAK